MDENRMNTSSRERNQAFLVVISSASVKAMRVDNGIPSASAMASMFLRQMFLSPRSTEPIYVRCTPTTSANDSWLKPSLLLLALMTAPKLF